MTDREGEPPVYRTVENDSEMNMAIEKAKGTLNVFEMAFQAGDYDAGTPALKIKFPVVAGFEHIWVSEISSDNLTYYGIIDNVPKTAKDIKLYDKIKIDKDDITDWMFGERGELVGGYTIRVIHSRMTKREKRDFAQNFTLKMSR